ncbi:hypothetical protein Ancab_039137, partial [Ancistrocladus abbreviatus]
MSKKKQNGECSIELRMSYAKVVRRNLTENGRRDRKNVHILQNSKKPSLVIVSKEADYTWLIGSFTGE